MYKVKAKLFSMSAAVVLLAACNRTSDVTSITGTVAAGDIDEVNVIVKESQIDTLVPVTDGKFSIAVPANVLAVGTIEAANYGVQFIPDGTRLTVELSEESRVTSSMKNSVQSRFTELQEKSISIQNEFREKATAIMSDTSLAEEAKTEKLDSNYRYYFGLFNDFNKKVVAENSDNILGVFGIMNLIGAVEEAELDSLISILVPELSENEQIKAIKTSLMAKKETAEGQMFKDFTISGPDGSEVSLSDYVGKGKYILVDFWASWCGPCKAEIPNIKAVYEKYRGKDFDVLSVAVWDRSPEASRDTAAAYGVNWNQIVNAGSIPTEIYGIEGIPHIILFGPDGTILKRNLREEAIEEEVAKYVK